MPLGTFEELMERGFPTGSENFGGSGLLRVDSSLLGRLLMRNSVPLIRLQGDPGLTPMVDTRPLHIRAGWEQYIAILCTEEENSEPKKET